VYCTWLDELGKPKPDPVLLSFRLNQVLDVFGRLKSVYPPAYLHDCVDGNDENRVFLNQTVISSIPKK
jgi:hypothetical protein